MMNATENPSLPKASGLDTNRKIMIGLALALVLVAGGMYVWKTSAVSAVQQQMATMQEEQAKARAGLIALAKQMDIQRAELALSRFSVPFAWSIRRELMASNLDQIDQYFTELVQIEGFQSAVLATPDGKVVVASDRKQLATPFSTLYPADYLQATAIRVDRTTSGSLRALIPIMGLNQHLGTVVLEFSPSAYTLQ